MFVLLCLIGTIETRCQVVASERGVTPVELPDGTRVYFKREVRGNNYDEMGISFNGDVCVPLDNTSDYIFEGMDHVIYYGVANNVITTYSTAALEEPGKVGRRFVVVNHVLEPLAWQDLARTFKTRGLNRIYVDVKKNARCK